YGVSPADPLTFITVAVLLSAVAGAACAIPGYRATRVQPRGALRDEGKSTGKISFLAGPPLLFASGLTLAWSAIRPQKAAQHGLLRVVRGPTGECLKSLHESAD